MTKHKKLLIIQDSVFASLRMICPTKRELAEAKTNIGAMEKLWRSLKFSITPKAHLIFSHAHDDIMVRLGGIGDKNEDFIEKRHQVQKRYNSITLTQHHGINQLKSQDVMEWRDDDPMVQQQIAEVDRCSLRLHITTREKSVAKMNQRKKEKVNCRKRKSKKVKWEINQKQL